MGIITFILNYIFNSTPSTAKTLTPLTEEDILKAIDELPEIPAPVKETSWPQAYTFTKVPKVKIWTNFKYIVNPDINLNSENTRIKFSIPCGFEWALPSKIWSLTAPFNAYDDEIAISYTLLEVDKK
jgi:hypothetical protein